MDLSGSIRLEINSIARTHRRRFWVPHCNTWFSHLLPTCQQRQSSVVSIPLSMSLTQERDRNGLITNLTIHASFFPYNLVFIYSITCTIYLFGYFLSKKKCKQARIACNVIRCTVEINYFRFQRKQQWYKSDYKSN